MISIPNKPKVFLSLKKIIQTVEKIHIEMINKINKLKKKGISKRPNKEAFAFSKAKFNPK